MNYTVLLQFWISWIQIFFRHPKYMNTLPIRVDWKKKVKNVQDSEYNLLLRSLIYSYMDIYVHGWLSYLFLNLTIYFLWTHHMNILTILVRYIT